MKTKIIVLAIGVLVCGLLFQPALAQKFKQVTDLQASWVGDHVRLTWTDQNPNEDGFDIYRSDGNPYNFYLIDTVGPANPNGSWNDYDEGTRWFGWGTYYYYVQPFKYGVGGGKEPGPKSNVASVDPPPAAPQNLVFTNAYTEMQHPHLMKCVANTKSKDDLIFHQHHT